MQLLWRIDSGKRFFIFRGFGGSVMAYLLGTTVGCGVHLIACFIDGDHQAAAVQSG
jgi:hypothetical protein